MYKCALSLIDYHFRNAHTCDIRFGFFDAKVKYLKRLLP